MLRDGNYNDYYRKLLDARGRVQEAYITPERPTSSFDISCKNLVTQTSFLPTSIKQMVLSLLTILESYRTNPPFSSQQSLWSWTRYEKDDPAREKDATAEEGEWSQTFVFYVCDL
jgi:hypothetical protein